MRVHKQGWSIRDYDPGDIYMTIHCPHGKPVEVINTDHKPYTVDQAAEALDKWLKEVSGWIDNYCYH